MNFNKMIQKMNKFSKSFYNRVDELSGGALEILRIALQRFTEERGSETAASLAYYAFFSIFPMLLVFVVVGSFFVDRSVLQDQLLNLLEGILPGAEGIIFHNINQVLKLRGTVTFIALISLIWTATSVFDILVKNINRAFRKASAPKFLKRRLIGFLLFLGLSMLMVFSIATAAITELIPVIRVPINEKLLHETFVWGIAGSLFPITINILMFWALYHWVPMIKVTLKASLLGGVFSGVIWELINRGFTWVISSQLIQYSLVYGSVGTIVALLFWIYLTATIMLIGAHLTASIHTAIKMKMDGQSK